MTSSFQVIGKFLTVTALEVKGHQHLIASSGSVTHITAELNQFLIRYFADRQTHTQTHTDKNNTPSRHLAGMHYAQGNNS